jgi:hypothetical protein
MPFKNGNKCACRPDKLTKDEIRQRKRERTALWRITHPYDPKKRRQDYLKCKLKIFSEIVSAGKNNA